jgi:hypothetical protein
MMIITKEKLKMKQAPETLQWDVGQRNDQCRHESHEDWRE